MNSYPHQLSGGMLQRIMIAMALSCEPQLLIADEPTTALDVTVQAQILQLLRERSRAGRMAMMLITHDLGVIAQMAEHVVVMYAGRVVEQGPTAGILRHPQHPYTRGLIAPARCPASAGAASTRSPARCRIWPPCRRTAPLPTAARAPANAVARIPAGGRRPAGRLFSS